MSEQSADDDFRKELLDLFAVEAAEWLEHARTALQELRNQGEADRFPALLEVIRGSLTNLGGSAATVELPNIEQLAYGVFPVLDSSLATGKTLSSADWEALQQQLECVAQALSPFLALGPVETTSGVEPEGGEHTIEDHTDARLPTSEEQAPPISPLALLLQMKAHSAFAFNPTRKLLDRLLKTVQDPAQENDGKVEARATQFLHEVEGLDEAFLKTVESTIQDITTAVSSLTQVTNGQGAVDGRLVPTIETVDGLREQAHRINAPLLEKFFHGLQGFLTIVATRGSDLVHNRVRAVEIRLGTVLPIHRPHPFPHSPCSFR